MIKENSSNLKFLDLKKKINYENLGFMCGIEVHQQLNTGKLFCSCPCLIASNDSMNKRVERRLSFSLSETGEVDMAAFEEYKKKKSNVYMYNDDVACLVDLDEEPPKGPNEKALSTAVRISQMLNLKFFDKLQFMRKIIIDGSVTSGYQRTAMLGLGGSFSTSFGKVEVNGVNLEEDACRTIERKDGHNVYCLDRQGIPLIEIVTGPQIKVPIQAVEVAKFIGNLLRSFPETRRGLGTIRQDLNVSIKEGARVEIKGAQNLKLIPDVIDNEIRRQEVHVSIIKELKSRGIDKNNFSDNKIYDVTDVFRKSTSKVVLDNLKEEGAKVLAVKLNGFKGILGHEMQENYRFASEVSDRNKKHFPMIKGLFHSDELPKYGISQEEVDLVNRELITEIRDAFILIVHKESIAKKSLKNVLNIISNLIEKVPSEVRQVDPKGTKTVYMRLMPGSARMYPETDIKEIELDSKYLSEQKKFLPEFYDKKIKRLVKKFGLDDNKVVEVLDKFSEEEFEEFLKIGLKIGSVYYVLFDLPKEVKKREGVEPIDLEFGLLKDIILAFSCDKLNKNSLYSLFVNLYNDNLSSLKDLDGYLKKKGLLFEKVDDKEIEEKIKEIVDKNKGAPFGALMGHCMKEFGSKVDGKKISEILKRVEIRG